MRRLVLVLVLGSLVVGCTSSADWSPTASPGRERLAEPLTFYNALEADQDYEEKHWAAMRDELGIVLSDEVRTDAYGSWHPLTVAPDAPLLDIDPEVLPDDLDPSWTPERLRETWQAMAEFLVSERLDSELVWDDTFDRREAVGARIDAGVFGWDYYSDPFHFAYYLHGETERIGFSQYGSVALDQNYGAWRQAGGEPDSALLVPANPAPYSLDTPRTLVDDVRVTGVEQNDEFPNVIDIEAHLRYERPIRVDGIEGRRYEQDSATIKQRMVYTDRPVFTEVRHVSLSPFRDVASVSHEARLRLPLLTAAPVEGWTVHEVSGLALGLPASAAPDDGPCSYLTSDEQPVQVFNLGMGVEEGESCLQIASWVPDEGDEPHAEVVMVNETIWGARAPGLLGTVDIQGYSTRDRVLFLLTEGPGPCYRITADVPSGTGEQFARQMLSTLDASAAASPSPSRT